jgi:hypothetical protein
VLAFQACVSQRRYLIKAAALLGDQCVGGAVIGIGALDQIVALRIAHDHVATMRGERHPDKAGGLRKVRIVDLLLKLLGEQFGKLVLKPFAFLIGERQIARVGAHPQHLGIDEFDRQIGATIARLRPSEAATGQRCGDRK